MSAQLESPPEARSASAGAGSPPPNCAICLGSCSNKCFSDSCMHQFCFKCLLEWSKVKAECPLCKKPFTSIIHNVKSNSEYDEHVLPVQMNDAVNRATIQYPPYLHSPPATPSRHQFHFRTTFTVDPGGELAIQQMLLSHPLTTNYLLPTSSLGRYAARPRRRDTSATSFRRSIYAENLWVTSAPDITGRYRNTSPRFYRENPAARQRLVPWLNRELNALLMENTQQIMHLVDIIMEYLLTYHIRSSEFRNMLREYLGSKTDHFVHEFYTFMRSPFDMIGYDRHVIYSDRPTSPSIDVLSDYDNDSDVAVVNTTVNPNTFQRPVFEVIQIDSDSSHESDVIIQEPEPVIVDLANTTTDEEPTASPVQDQNGESTSANFPLMEEERRQPLLPLKIRLKHKRQSREKRGRKRHRRSSSSSSSSTSSCTSVSSSSSSSGDESPDREFPRKRHKHKKKAKSKYRSYKEYKSRRKSESRRRNSRSEERAKVRSNNSSDSDDYLPLAKLSNREKHKKQKRHKEKRTVEWIKSVPEQPRYSLDYSGVLQKIRFKRSIEECEESGCSYSDHYHHDAAAAKVERDSVTPDYLDRAGPSGSRAVQVKTEQVASPRADSCSSD